MPPRKAFHPASFVCPILACRVACKSSGGLRQHMDTMHSNIRACHRQDMAGGSALPTPSGRTSPPLDSGSELEPDDSRGDNERENEPDPNDPGGEDEPEYGEPLASDHEGSPQGSPPPSPNPLPRPHGITTHYHPLLDGTPCDIHGDDLPPHTPPPPREDRDMDDFSPFNSRPEFKFAEFAFAEEEMSSVKLDKHLQNLAALYPD